MTPKSESDLPHAWLLAQLDRMEKSFADSHARIRTDMNEGFRSLSNDFRAHERTDQDVADRVLVIETERKAEATATAKLAAFTSTFVTALVIGGVEAFKRMVR